MQGKTGKTSILHSIVYRPDIDGLRAIAILTVLLFHCGFRTFSGGFVGVDVFFVISGYLITSLILTDLRKGTFSFANFYGRRIRRLLPALLVTVLLSLLVAPLILSPKDFVDAAKSGGLATVSLSNFYFAKSASYFDTSAQSKPFLHMWSLSLEEQFYLFWPATLVFLHRWKRSWVTPALIIICIPIGIAISQFWITKNPNHAYFLLHTRGFQFLMGAACIWLPRFEIRSNALGNVIGVAGLAMIFVPTVLFSEATPFPGLAAAVPSLGAMFLIWQGQRRPIRSLLANRWMVWFGRISYSTYLVHWPIIVFWLYLSVDAPSAAEKLALLFVCIAAGQLLDSSVTQRFRYAQPERIRRWRFPAAQMSLFGLIGVICGATIVTSGMPARFELVPSVAAYRDESSFPFLRGYGDGVLHISSAGKGRVLIFGDSMMQNYVPAILQLDGIRNAQVDIVTRGGCVLAENAVLVNHGSPDRACVRLRDYLYGIQDQYDLVIWSQNWLGYGTNLRWEDEKHQMRLAFEGVPTFSGWRDGIARTLKHFAERAKKVVVIGSPVTVDNVSPILQRIGPLTDVRSIAAELTRMRESPNVVREPIERGIRDLVTSRPNTLYIDPHAIICEDRQRCRLSEGGVSYYLDSLHNTAAAMSMLRAGLENAGLQL